MTGEVMLALAARRASARPMGQRETAPPPPRRVPDLGPLPRAPKPPDIAEPEIRRVPAEPRAAVDRAQAESLLALAKSARAGVQQAVARGEEPGASAAERAAAARAKGCMGDLVAKVPDLDRAILTLEAAATQAPGPGQASLDLAEIQAIEAFAKCAGPLMAAPGAPVAEPKPDLVRAAAGIGIPAALSILLSLLRA